MDPERLRQVTDVLRGALQFDSLSRPAFLERACAGDDALRQQVESLLSDPGPIDSHTVERLVERSGTPDADEVHVRLAQPESDSGSTVSTVLPSTHDRADRGVAPVLSRLPFDNARFPSGHIFDARYRIVSLLGRGGMGEVYRAEDLKLAQPVALKLLPFRVADGDARLQRFISEVRLARGITHPNVCRVFDIGNAEGWHYLSMEYIDGETLASLLKRIGRLPAEKVLDVARQLCAGLAAAHEQGILHRDLKPSNIMVDGRGRIRIMDFGLAVLSGQATAGQVAGTPAYMAPEQLAGDLVTPQSDLFGLGVVLYELFVGRALFPVRTFEERLTIGHNERSARLALQDVDTAVEGIIRSCLSDAPAHRPASAQAIADTLTRHDASTTSLRDDTQRRTASLAVLPFANTSRDPGEEYFSDGLAGEIINALAHIPGLQVIARTSSFAFKGKHEDVRQIANTLGVTHVLEGSVHRIGGRLRVTAHLVQAANGAQTWSDRYDREVADVFAVQDEIATAIASALSVSMPRAADATSRPHEPSLPAYDAYLKGVYHLPTRLVTDPTPIKRAVEFFRQASVLDPDWSIPHASLAYLIFFYWQIGIPSPEPMVVRAREEAERALVLTPSEPTSNAVMGAIAASYDYDWDDANRRFRRALTSESLPPTVHDLYAQFYLSPLGQFDAAIEHQQKAIACDPLHLWWRVRLLPLLIYGGRYEQAILEASRVLEFESDSFFVQFWVASARIFQGAVKEARVAAEEACRLAPWSDTAKGLLAGILVQAGVRERAQTLLDSITTPAFAGRIYYHVLAAESDTALDWYERAAEQRLPVATELASAIFLQSVRSTPRWLGIARMLNLPSAR